MAAPATIEPGWHGPRSKRKHQAILGSATEAFLEAGYGATTMDDIAARAGVSKQTVYHHFGSKEALFSAILEERCARFLSSSIRSESRSGDLEEDLRALGRDFLERVLSPSSLALHRLVVGESARFPELGRISYESARRLVKRLAEFLDTHAGRNRLSIDDTELAAEQFLGMLLGLLQLRAILCGEAGGCLSRIEPHVDHAVAVFLEGCRRG